MLTVSPEKIEENIGKGSISAEEIQYILKCPPKEFKKLIETSWKLTRKLFGWKLHCYAPNILTYNVPWVKIETKNIFLPFSVTGRKCMLMCEHCKGKLLESMIPATAPEDFLKKCGELVNKGCKGVLLSGGALQNGEVPLKNFAQVIKEVKERYKLTVAAHTGLVDKETAEALGEAGLDAAMIDIIGDEETIQKIYHLNKKPEDYKASLQYLKDAGIPVTPHVVVGLHYGKIKGEIRALEIIKEVNPESLVIVVFKPLPESAMDKVKPPSPLEVSRIIVTARFMLPNTPILLGCARPEGTHKMKTDIIAIKSGVNGVAFPTEEGVSYAEKLGLKITYSPLCCSLIFME
ncbi:MAG: radical SAM protein [Candidatus Odinarchaeia archaeon]